jgi:pSer/pThr/pTyr-binding forkhead associated (FHA) protein
MSKTREWIIGADPGCDIVVNAPSVSSRHCRLIRDANGFAVEDLESTNGTWVNGVRCTERQRVSRKDQLTLGQTVPMPWPEKQSTGSARTITIGRLPDNDVVLDDPMVSGRHAEITVKDGRATITDLNSRNGTSIGSVDRKVQSAPMETNDTVFFGTLAFLASDLLEPGAKVEPVDATIPVCALPRELIDAGGSGSSMSRLRKSRWSVYAAIGAPAALVIVIITAMVANSGNETPSSEEPDSSGKPTASVPVDPETTLYWILVKDTEEATPFRVGTAVAIGKRHLLTSGSVIKAIAALQDEFPKVTVFCPKTEKQSLVDFGKSKLHPKFESAYQAAKGANRKYEAAGERMQRLIDEIKNLEKAGGKPKRDVSNDQSKKQIAGLKDRIKKLGSELQSWDDRVLTNSERATCFDLGVLELQAAADPLPGHLSVAAANAPRQSGDAVVVWGNPYPSDSPLLPLYSGNRSQKLAGRIRMLKRLDPKAADPFRLVVKSERNLADSQWAGAAVLDGENRIVGVFSRLTPSNADKPPQGDLLDVPLATRLRDFFPIGESSSPSKED